MKVVDLLKIAIESPYPPKNKHNLWVDIDENTRDIKTVKQFINGEWKTILSNSCICAECTYTGSAISVSDEQSKVWDSLGINTPVEDIANSVSYPVQVIKNDTSHYGHIMSTVANSTSTQYLQVTFAGGSSVEFTRTYTASAWSNWTLSE